MTNTVGLYFCSAVAFIVAAIVVYMVVKRNADGKFDKSMSQTAAKNPYLTTLLYPLFILLMVIIVGCVFLFHVSEGR
jgi:uncharacterized membrane protein